jgi:hypothetical protein
VIGSYEVGRGFSDARLKNLSMLRWRRIEARLPNITRERLRVMNKWLFWLWVFPGIPVSFYLRNSVAWVVFLSAYAIIIAHLIEWRQEAESSTGRR